MKTLLIILVSALPAASQDITISIGTSHYLGDLGGNKGIGRNGLKDFNLKSTGVSFGVTAKIKNPLRRSIPEEEGVSKTGQSKVNHFYEFQINYITLHDDDKYAKLDGDSWYRWIRGYKFRTSIIELSILKSIELWQVISLSTGFSSFWVCNMTKEERATSNVQFGVPITGSIKGDCLGLKAIGLNITWRKCFTDYLDGYSLRADPRDNDSFFTISLSYTFIKQVNYLKCPKSP